jgi:hypothetical protein
VLLTFRRRPELLDREGKISIKLFDDLTPI